MVCINGTKKERIFNFSGIGIGEVEEYKYLGVTVKAGFNGGFRSMVRGYNGGCEWSICMLTYASVRGREANM